MSFVTRSTSSENIDHLLEVIQETASVKVSVPDNGAKVREGADLEAPGSLLKRTVVHSYTSNIEEEVKSLARDLGLEGEAFLHYPKFLKKVAALPDERKEALVPFLNAMCELGLVSFDYFRYSHWEDTFQIPSEKLQALIPLAQGILRDVDQALEEDAMSRGKKAKKQRNITINRKSYDQESYDQLRVKKSSVRLHFKEYLVVISKFPQELWGKATVLLTSMLIYTAMVWKNDHHFFFDSDSLEGLVRFCKNKESSEIRLFVEERFVYFDRFCVSIPNEPAMALGFAFLVKPIPIEILVPFYQRVEQLFKESELPESESDPEFQRSNVFLGILQELHVDGHSLQNLENNFWIFKLFKEGMTLDDLNFAGYIILPFLSLMSFSQQQVDILKSAESAVLKIQTIETRFYFLRLLLNLPIEAQHRLLELCQNEDQWLDLVSAIEAVIEEGSGSESSDSDLDVALNFLYAIISRMDFDINELKAYWTKILMGADEAQAHFLYNYFEDADLSGEHAEFMKTLNEAGIRLGYLDEDGHPYGY